MTTDDSGERPYIYEARIWVKVLATGAFLFFLALIGYDLLNGTTVSGAWNRLIEAGGVLAGAWWWLLIFRRRLLLWPDAFEFRGNVRTMSGSKADIAGYRINTSRYGTTLKFRLHSPDDRTFSVPDYRNRPGFAGWIRDLPNLDEVDREDHEKALNANQAFGLDERRRTEALARHRTIMYAVNGAGSTVAVWLVFLPQFRADLAEIACLVFMFGTIAAVALSGGRYAVINDLKSPRLPLTLACLAPAAALAYHYVSDVATLDKTAVLLPAIISGVALTGLVAAIDRTVRPYVLAMALVTMTAGSWGGLIAYDHLADQGVATNYSSPIVDKQRWHSRSTTHYDVIVAPWGDPDMPRTFGVNSNFYYGAAVGQSMCMTLHHGTLGYRWLGYDACR